MSSFVSRTYMSADGLALHYRDYAGPEDAKLVVLCLPGLTRNARDFEDLAAHLSKRYRVLCADLRGRGSSAYAPNPMTYLPPVYVQDVAALLEAAGVARVALIGTSLGGIIAMLMAATMPQRLRGVVLNDVGPELDAAGMARIGQYVGKSAPLASWDEAAGAVARAEAAIYPGFTPADWTKQARRRFVAMADGRVRADYDLDIAKPFATAFAPVDLWPFFAALKGIPTLAIRGELSDLLSAEVFARMKRENPELEQVVVANRGHVPLLDEPAAAAAIDGFLARLPGRRAAMGPMAMLKRWGKAIRRAFSGSSR